MKKIITVLGARPQFIKASVVSHAIANTHGLSEVLVHTGQHFDVNMSDVFFKELGINKPKYFLGIHGGTHGVMTGRMLEAVEQVLIDEKPDIVLVYGDTNSTLAGALSAAKLNIPVAHVEAGLRSFNLAMPEEVNRILTDRISKWLFTPTQTATSNLQREGYDEDKIIEVGDVMYDVALHHGSRVKPNTGLMSQLGLTEKNYLLATIHRQENTDHPLRLKAIVDALIETAKKIPVVWPLHPRTRSVLGKAGLLDTLAKQVKLIEPIGYLDMVQLEKFASLIATDSGGVQKEAFFYQVPCVTLRDETEWVELIDTGWNRLAAPNNSEFILSAIQSSLGQLGKIVKPYGDGKSAEKIATVLSND
jgi:UDP-GlcNAc3NAcA epimerase